MDKEKTPDLAPNGALLYTRTSQKKIHEFHSFREKGKEEKEKKKPPAKS